jgi:hypothetical protein
MWPLGLLFVLNSGLYRDGFNAEVYCQHIMKWLNITILFCRYFIQMKAFRGLTQKGDIAIDDVSLSPECFSHVTSTGSHLTFTYCCSHSEFIKRVWSRFLAHLSWKLKWAFLIACCLSYRLSVLPSVCLLDFYIFNFSSRTAWPILTKVGTNHS